MFTGEYYTGNDSKHWGENPLMGMKHKERLKQCTGGAKDTWAYSVISAVSGMSHLCGRFLFKLLKTVLKDNSHNAV